MIYNSTRRQKRTRKRPQKGGHAIPPTHNIPPVYTPFSAALPPQFVQDEIEWEEQFDLPPFDPPPEPGPSNYCTINCAGLSFEECYARISNFFEDDEQIIDCDAIEIRNFKLRQWPPIQNLIDSGVELMHFSLYNWTEGAEIGLPPTLHELRIRRISIDTCPNFRCNDALYRGTSIDTLAILNCQLTEFPVGICYMRRLSTLYLSNNPIQNVPNEINQLYLQSLSLVNTAFTEFPTQLFGLSITLIELNFGSPYIIVLPSLTEFVYLERLTFTGCYCLTALPPIWLDTYDKIYIDISNTQIRTLPHELIEFYLAHPEKVCAIRTFEHQLILDEELPNFELHIFADLPYDTFLEWLPDLLPPDAPCAPQRENQQGGKTRRRRRRRNRRRRYTPHYI